MSQLSGVSVDFVLVQEGKKQESIIENPFSYHRITTIIVESNQNLDNLYPPKPHQHPP
jgi:hypothetical protein